MIYKVEHLNIIGNPPALPGDIQCLTFPDRERSLQTEPFKVQACEAPDGNSSKSKPHEVGMQIPCDLDTNIQKEIDI